MDQLTSPWFWAFCAAVVLLVLDRVLHFLDRRSLLREIHSLTVRVNARTEPEARESLQTETKVPAEVVKEQAIRLAAEEKLRRESYGDLSRFAAP